MPNTYPNLYSVIDLEKNLLQDSSGQIITYSNQIQQIFYNPPRGLFSKSITSYELGLDFVIESSFLFNISLRYSIFHAYQFSR